MSYKIKKMIKKILRWGNNNVYLSEKEYVLNPSKMKRFDGKIAIITGASGAIGRAISIRLASEGAIVYVAGRTISNLKLIVDEIRSLGFNANVLELDVTNEKSIEKLIEFERIDIFVNCAGGSTRNKSCPFPEQTTEIINDMLDMNLKGTMFCCRVVSRKMKEQKYGHIINISSAVAMRGMANFCDYAASKAGVIGFSQSLALEMAPYNITVNCISPGFIQRGTIQNETYDRILKKCPMNKIGSHEDIAAAVAFLASDEAGFITGQNLAVDGGRTLGLYSES